MHPPFGLAPQLKLYLVTTGTTSAVIRIYCQKSVVLSGLCITVRAIISYSYPYSYMVIVNFDFVPLLKNLNN